MHRSIWLKQWIWQVGRERHFFMLCVLGMSFEGESVGLACAGGQGPNLHLQFGNGARHAELQVGTSALPPCEVWSPGCRTSQKIGLPSSSW